MGRKQIKISSKVEDIVHKFLDGHFLKREDIIHLLRIDHQSMDASFVRSAANAITRSASDGKAEVHAQIGLNLSPCPNNCSFCAFAAKNGVFRESQELPIEDIILLAVKAEADGANALFFMTTHEPSLFGAVSGANLFWAEVGTNPRDTETGTSRGRGLDTKSCIEMFREADFEVLKGPSVIYNKMA